MTVTVPSRRFPTISTARARAMGAPASSVTATDASSEQTLRRRLIGLEVPAR